MECFQRSQCASDINPCMPIPKPKPIVLLLFIIIQWTHPSALQPRIQSKTHLTSLSTCRSFSWIHFSTIPSKRNTHENSKLDIDKSRRQMTTDVFQRGFTCRNGQKPNYIIGRDRWAYQFSSLIWARYIHSWVFFISHYPIDLSQTTIFILFPSYFKTM